MATRFSLVTVLVACGVATTACHRAPPRGRPAASGSTSTAEVATPSPRCPLGAVGADGLTGLERPLRDAVRDARFDEVVDLAPAGEEMTGPGARPAPAPVAHRPSVDVAVIAFPEGCPPVFANAMSSRDFAGVRLNRFDPATLATSGVRYRRWDQARWDATSTVAPFADEDDVVPPRAGEAAVDFVVPYPASVFKLLVAVKLLQLVDRGALGLEDRIALGARTRALREWLGDMITWSDDESTRALMRRLHALGEAARIDALFGGLGLATLQIHDTSPETGRNWQPGRIHLSAWDTARLLWLLDPEAPPPAWKRPDGSPVDGGFLTAASKRLLLGLLQEQAFHDVLSTTALCRLPRTTRGIPAFLPERWIGDDGRPLVGIGRGAAADSPGADVRECNADAEVTFAHKTGLTLNFGSDAGIVRGIPGRARRHYVIAFFSNLGYRYTDADKAAVADPCRDLGICYTQRIAGLGAAIDAALAAVLETEAGAVPPAAPRGP